MTISGRCPSCGKNIKAPDSAAGKTGKCPGCGTVIRIPEPVYDAEVVPDDEALADYGGIEDYDDYEDDSYDFAELARDERAAPTEEERRPCPICGEMIVATAAKCRFCGEIFDESLIRRKKKKQGRGTDDEEAELTSLEILACFLCSGLTCIYGVIELIRGRPVRGGKFIGLSLLASFLWHALNLLIRALAQ
ncbi:MAG TPA: hypothetical protein EYP14_16835 [Planctomycetaceae bacterium]|nr:hypothetical protein [Planctomycetaceae bacterium]